MGYSVVSYLVEYYSIGQLYCQEQLFINSDQQVTISIPCNIMQLTL